MNRLGLRARKRFLYIFDFGEEWRVVIRVEKAGLAPGDGKYPRIVEEHGEAPPQYWDGEEKSQEDEQRRGKVSLWATRNSALGLETLPAHNPCKGKPQRKALEYAI